MKKLSVAAALATALAFTGAVSAQETSAGIATLVNANGKVMVDRGAGYVVVTGSTPLNNGDRVITLAGSSAEISFADGCRSLLNENNAMLISTEDGCKAAITQVTPTGAGASGPGTPVSQIVGPLVAAGLIIGVISEWDSDTPISAQ